MNQAIATPQPVAVVTGAARGIGAATAAWFLGQGYRVALLDIAHDELSQTAKQFAAVGPVLALDCDVSSEQSVATAFSTIESTWGRIDALVNNAGVAVFKPILDTTYKEWRYVLDANLDGIFLCSQAGGQIMKRQGSGSIVNIASISGLRASTLRVAYGTSKAAVVHLTKQYAVELGAIGIRSTPWHRVPLRPKWPSWCTRRPSEKTTRTPFRLSDTVVAKRSPTPSASSAPRRQAISTDRS